MPPLRDRDDDIPQIVDFCLQNLVKDRKTRVSKVSKEAIDVLTGYRWPGNVRELENVIYRSAVIAQGDAILPKDLPPEIAKSSQSRRVTVAADSPALESQNETRADSAVEISPNAPMSVADALDLLHDELIKESEPILARIEREMVERVLKGLDGNQAKAAEKLGMTRTTLRKRIETYGLKS